LSAALLGEIALQGEPEFAEYFMHVSKVCDALVNDETNYIFSKPHTYELIRPVMPLLMVEHPNSKIVWALEGLHAGWFARPGMRKKNSQEIVWGNSERISELNCGQDWMEVFNIRYFFRERHRAYVWRKIQLTTISTVAVIVILLMLQTQLNS
jgi:hypothetical protein